MEYAHYNNHNLPDSVCFPGGNTLLLDYLSDGRRVRTNTKTYRTALIVPLDDLQLLSDPSSETEEVRDGDFLFRDGRLSRLETPGGYVSLRNDTTGEKRIRGYYYIKDYLGSVRLTCDYETGEVLQSMEYLPSGAIFRRTGYDIQNRRFCGKEELSMHGFNMYDSGARLQYTLVPRFSTMDPLLEKYYDISPYVYCANNPVRFVDPDGRDWYEYTDKDGNTQTMWRKSQDKTYKDSSGNIWNNIGENYLFINGDNATLFTQHKNDKGELYLSSSSYNLADEKSANTLTSTLGDILSKGSAMAGGLGGSAEGSNATFRLTNSKGALDFKFYGNGWKGNQWITTNSISNLGKVVQRAGKLAGYAGIFISGIQFMQAPTLEGKLEHGFDTFIGGIGFFPVVGTGISLYWSFGGKKLH